MSDELKEKGLFWHPLGGNNIDQISGHCYHYMDISSNKNNESIKTSIIIDIGKYDNHSAFNVENSVAALPDIRFLLNDDASKAKAILLTHSHPDHINGIVHYIKAGYKLPPLYSGAYTFMILEDLFNLFDIPKTDYPEFNIIKDGDILNIGSFTIEALSSSHTCFDSLGFVLKTDNATIYHSGDMKIDASTYFRKPTNIKRLKMLKGDIDVVMADFCQIYKSGFTHKEVDTFKRMIESIKASRKKKIFIPVYPTHPEMYIIAFLAALKMKKNVVFCGSKDFYSYLELITRYEISFDEIAKNKIKILYHPNEDLASLDDNYVIIGDFNNLPPVFNASSKDSYAIITSKTFFNPIRKILKREKIEFIDSSIAPELQGYGHGFIEDYKYLNEILGHPTFIPSHCPRFVIDSFRNLAKMLNIKIINRTPMNNEIYKIAKNDCELIKAMPAVWLIAVYDNNKASFMEVYQVPTAGKGNIRSTISYRRSNIHIKAEIHKEKKRHKIK